MFYFTWSRWWCFRLIRFQYHIAFYLILGQILVRIEFLIFLILTTGWFGRFFCRTKFPPIHDRVWLLVFCWCSLIIIFWFIGFFWLLGWWCQKLFLFAWWSWRFRFWLWILSGAGWCWFWLGIVIYRWFDLIYWLCRFLVRKRAFSFLYWPFGHWVHWGQFSWCPHLPIQMMSLR